MSDKGERYAALVRARKTCHLCAELTNPADIESGRLDSDQIGPWTRWQGNLHADVMVIGQEWGTVGHFVKHGGWDRERDNPTNRTLRELLETVVGSVPPAGPAPEPQVVFLTNAVLCLKPTQGGFQGRVEDRWFENCRSFLKSQVELVRPRVVIAVGQRAFNSILLAYVKTPPAIFRTAVEDHDGTLLPNGVRVFGVYHTGNRSTNFNRDRREQLADWQRIRRAFDERND